MFIRNCNEKLFCDVINGVTVFVMSDTVTVQKY